MSEELSRLNFDIETAKTRRVLDNESEKTQRIGMSILASDAMCCCRNTIYIILMVGAIVMLIMLILAPVYS